MPVGVGVRLGSPGERWRERHLRLLMLAPALTILGALTLFPTLYMFTASVQRVSADPGVPRAFVGLDNFIRMASDSQFHVGLLNTVIFTACAVTLEFLLGLGLALLFDRFIRQFNFLKTVLMIPMMLPPIAVAITWKLIYQPQFGVLNELMYRLGLPLRAWAGDVHLAMFTIILADIWEWTPFVFLLMLAGLASLPVEPYEAAEIDGASAWQQFWDLVFILTGGGPANATIVLSLYIFQVAFRFVDIGYAAAISLFVLAVTTVLSTWFIKRMKLAD